MTEELERVKHSNTNRDIEIEKLFEKHQQDQKEIGRLRNTQSAGSLFDPLRYKHTLPREGVEELWERLRKRREKEDAEEALKEKVRQMRMERLNLPADSKPKDAEGQPWFVRWKGEEYFDKLTEEEREMSWRL